MATAVQTYALLYLTILLGIRGTVKPLVVALTRPAQMYSYRDGDERVDGVPKKNAMSVKQNFSNFDGLNKTVVLEKDSIELMSVAYCGVNNKMHPSTKNRSKRYALQGSTWNTRTLTYKILNYPSRTNMQPSDIDAEIARAFAVWSEYTDLTFIRQQIGRVHISISFVLGEHDDSTPFDGPGGQLAHAYYPEFGGTTHFDDSEEWTMGTSKGFNFFQTAAHEFGHALGLKHSSVYTALMTAVYHGYKPNFRLDPDDIAGIQALYGKKSNVVPHHNHLCVNPKIDTIFNSANGEKYVFKGDLYYKLDSYGVAQGYPKLISQGWPGLPGNIDAAFALPTGATFFFKGTRYWCYYGHEFDGHPPRMIAQSFPGVPAYLDTAFMHSQQNKIYFFKGNLFWVFNLQTMTVSQPRWLSNVRLPNGLDGALQDVDGYLYFFKDDKYYRFDENTDSVAIDNPPFPRSTTHWWFGC